MKRLTVYTFIVMATVTAVIFLWQFRVVVGLFFLSLALASAARPPAIRLTRRGLPLWSAIVLTYLTGLMLAAGLLLLLGSQMLAEAQELIGAAAVAYESSWLAWTTGTTSQQAVANRLPPPRQLFEAIGGPQGELLAQRLFDLVIGLATVLGGLIVAVALSVYWTADQARFERLWLSLLPAERRAQARLTWQAMDRGVGAYIRSEIGQSFVGILLLFAGYWFLGVPYPALLALLGGIAWLVPLVGVALTVIPTLLVGLTVGPVLAAAAVLYTVVILLALELLVEPRLFNRRRYSSILTVLVMLVLVEDFGVFGLILAPPLSAAVQILGAHWLTTQKTAVPLDAPSQLAALREQLASVQMVLRSQQEPAAEQSLEIGNVAERLEKLVGRADQIILKEV